MSNNPVTENPNDAMPSGKPLEHDEVVSEDGDEPTTSGPAATERTDLSDASEFEKEDNDLVNVGKFTDPQAED